MELPEARFEPRSVIFAGREARAEKTRCSGLWAVGSLAGLAAPTVAVVGSRAPSEAGRTSARRLGEALARAGVCVLSGLAMGIDGAAHEGSLAGGGPTIGVLGGGHRHFFPRANRELAHRILAAGGAVLSPFAPDEPARPPQFIQRNGVVAALADAVVVVEAAVRSGALNTAGWAASLGIDVLAYPGDVDRPKAAGCNALIRDGAILARGPADIFEALGLPARSDGASSAAGAAEPGTQLEGRILRALAGGPRSFDDLLEAAGGKPPELSAALVTLELAGAIRREAGAPVYALA
jgi:DNA processing protein